MNTANRMQAWFLQPTPIDRVQGDLQHTQAVAMHALLQCQAQAQIHGALAEIGIFHGKTLIGLIRAAKDDERVLGIDPLKIGNTDFTRMLEANLMEHLTSEELDRLKVRCNFSTDLNTEAWAQALGMPARFVHLNGHHARSTMLHDLQLAGSYLVEGGVVVIDDFLNELHPDSTSDILEALAAQTLLEPVAVIAHMGHLEEGGSKLVCATKGYAKHYVAYLDEALSDHLHPNKDELLGNPIRVYRSTMAEPAALVNEDTDQALPVVFALHDSNGEYWLNAAVAMTSVGVHASAPLHFHVLHDETLHTQAKERLLSVAQSFEQEISFHLVTLPAGLNDIDLHRFSPASLYRLMIPQLFAHEEVVVYLDADLVCHGVDVHALVQMTPSNKAIGAVIDPHIAKAENHQHALAALQINASRYINSGVLVIRPPLIRDDLLIAFKLFFQRFPKALHPDQDFLNLIFSSRIERFPAHFNWQVGMFDRSLFQPLPSYNQKIIHYAGKLKPLDGNLAPGFLVFWMYAMLVPEIAHLNPNMRYVRPVKDAPNSIVREPATIDV